MTLDEEEAKSLGINEWFFDEKHDKMNGKIEQI